MSAMPSTNPKPMPDSCEPPPPPSRIALMPPPPSRAAPPTAITRKDMPAVRVPAEAEEAEPVVFNEERITQVSAPPGPASQTESVVLIRLDGVDAGSLVSLGTETCAIGRHHQNQLQIEDGGVSRFHARVTWLGNAHAIEDLASSNGTWVRGRRISRAVLGDGDLVQFGSHACFRYTVTDGMHERLLRQLHESSTRDPLTGAYNRRHFEERLRAELAYAVRHGTELGVILFDIDHFKRVNDTRGHAAGDAVIRHLAQVTQAQLRSEDVFARYGGEEFVVLLRATDAKNTQRVAERIRASIEVLPASFEAQAIPVSVSGGCATLGEGGERTGPAMLRRADERLYAAKRAGRNRVVGVATPPGQGRA
ncbi:MAG: GGDEF domain-containing protein [Myxococcales bacterium]|nr:GGDEF domain-containing protein [Myxococcales bacterium]